jgi:quercetin dioxygenase-like cupin family protein
MELLERRRVIGDKAMISHITLRRGFKVATHAHENEQFSVVLSGKLKFELGAEGGDRREAIVGRARSSTSGQPPALGGGHRRHRCARYLQPAQRDHRD